MLMQTAQCAICMFDIVLVQMLQRKISHRFTFTTRPNYLSKSKHSSGSCLWHLGINPCTLLTEQLG